MKIITKKDKEYPQQLKGIKNEPKKLYTMGNVNLFNTYSIAIIGSRCCTREGKNIAMKFARELAVQGITIVSGMAKGIDAAAHKGALEVEGNTIAVLGNGFNHIFPKENINLYKKIVQKGLVVTEYELEEKAKKENFPQRNRIVSGLSIGVLIIEAKKRSGTSITAKFAMEQERAIFCIPHSINVANGVGTNRLIRNGNAKLITNVQEIMEEFSFLEYSEKKAEKLKITKPKVKVQYQDIFDLINSKPITSDEICYITKKELKEVNVILSMLEIEGYIKKVAGGFIAKKI